MDACFKDTPCTCYIFLGKLNTEIGALSWLSWSWPWTTYLMDLVIVMATVSEHVACILTPFVGRGGTFHVMTSS